MRQDETFSVEELRAARNRFLAAGAILVIGTIVTVAMYYVHFEYAWQTITVALLIASIKGCCVAAIFMHLSHPERPISLVLLFTATFLAAMLGFFLYSVYCVPRVETTGDVWNELVHLSVL